MSHLHGHDGAQDVEGGVGDVEARGEAATHQKGEHVDGDDVDDEHVATPGCHHVEVRQRAQGRPLRGAEGKGVRGGGRERRWGHKGMFG